ncbi:hypothetical protein [Streptomyces avidinii]|uniref:DUF222 domain-containing protein n=1 Tax=Streptomyces avidinii TaxID=1895 RepID=A0ABS4KWQ7_STRAV|nr:hypothetical protein [Streptomyces avidinii]MBP2034457.1 hypothetical protein [Streptomyces avidinii]GGY86396.1 hypothetical protein GCM10010343_09210 [Streptomyces avidinii]
MKDRPVGSSSGSASPPHAQRLLAIYLNDHLAGASSGVSLIRRMARAHRGTPAGPPLAELAEQIAEDRESLREIMTALDVPAQWHRVVVGRLAEKAGRVKLNGHLVSRSPLSDVLELEAMRIGVEGKASLWQSLGLLADTADHLDRAAVDRLLTRARHQAAVLDRLHGDAARRSITSAPAAAPPSARRTRGLPRRTRWA